MNIKRIKIDTSYYPSLLSQIHDPPNYLYANGNIELLHNKCIAIVGSRKMSSYGEEVTKKLSYNLSRGGFTIVSGLALGVDGTAHKSALESSASTIAVLASGVDEPTPKSHRSLAEKIIENNGLIISEYEPGTPAMKHRFPERNRIIAGLSVGVVVTEASQKSGSLITARLALEENREVFAVPGNIDQPNSRGTNGLIKNGAVPVTTHEDVLHVLGYEKGEKQTPRAENALEAQVITLINDGIRNPDAMTTQSDAAPKELQKALTMLEIRGTIRRSSSGEWYIV